MKKYLHLYVIVILTLLFSCKKILNKEPLNIISSDAVWNDERLSEAFLDQTLSEMTFMFANCDYDPRGALANIHVWDIHDQITRSDEARHAYPWYPTFTTWGPGLLNKNGGFNEQWLYPTIRECNEFIEAMKTSTLSVATKTYLSARARWARAMCYFGMVERYGGVPLVTTAQSIDEPSDSLYMPRSKEEDVYKFIISEMDEIIPDMLSTEASGYPSRWAALALKSRAAMYAASIAEWGTVQDDGIVGIPQQDANYFWQQCYNASDSIIASGVFQLYNKIPGDPVSNYHQLFVDPDNPESIYAVQFKGTEGVGLNNGWDMFTGPQGYVSWAGNAAAPYLETIEWFQHADGSLFTLDANAIKNKLWDNINEVFPNMDPRFYADIYTEGTEWQSDTLDFHTSLREPDGTVITTGSYGGVPAQGVCNKDGGAITGFGIKKYVNENTKMPDNWTTQTPWMVFRFSEILLNQAEACIELNKNSEALNLINQIRNRAGVKAYIDIDRNKVRHEREIELMFETNHLFDLKRWRTAVNAITRTFSGVTYTLDYSTGKFLVNIVPDIDGSNQKKFFDREYYYPINASYISDNAALSNNPGY